MFSDYDDCLIYMSCMFHTSLTAMQPEASEKGAIAVSVTQTVCRLHSNWSYG